MPVGETVFSETAPKEQPAPETLRQNGPQEDGSLESGACLPRHMPTDEVSRFAGESFRSPDRGGRERRSFASGNATLTETFLTEAPAGPLKHTPLYALHRSSARASCRSPATRCRCSTRPAFWP